MQIYSLLYTILGFDLLSISSPFGSIRVSIGIYFLVFIFFVVKREIVFSKREIFSFSIFVLFLTVSSLFSFNPMRSIGYIFSILLSFFLYFSVWKAISRKLTSSELVGVIISSGRMQICLLVLEYIAIDSERPSLFYYEPSYMAIALAPYVLVVVNNLALKNGKMSSNFLDLAFLCSFIFISKSANLILAILLSMVFSLRGTTLKFKLYIIFLSFITLAGAYVYSVIGSDLVAVSISKIIESDNPLIAILERTGNRWNRMVIAYDAALSNYNYVIGVGAGVFSEFSDYFNSSFDYSFGMPWNEPRGYPATNIFLELLVESGIGALISFLFFLKVTVAEKYNHVLKMSIYLMLTLLLIESSIMRPYLWACIAIVSTFPLKSNENKNV